MKERLCVGELAAMLDVHRATIYRWIADGIIPFRLVRRSLSGRIYFLAHEIKLYENRIERAQCDICDKIRLDKK